MNGIITAPEQGTTEWLQERLGHFTSSEIFRLMTEPIKAEDKKAGKLSDGAETYVLEKVYEELTGISKDFVNEAMEWGTKYEPLARQWYEKKNNVHVEQIGFVKSFDLDKCYGGSVDGLTELRGLEIKCPFNGINHLHHLLIANQEYFKHHYKNHYAQCQSNMYICDKSEWDFVSFDPRIDTDAGYFQFTVKRDEEYINRMCSKIKQATELKQAILIRCGFKSKKYNSIYNQVNDLLRKTIDFAKSKQ